MATTLTLKSGIFEIRPKKLLFVNAGGPFSLTPKQTYHAFLTDNDRYPIVIVKDGYRYFPVLIEYARNNFDYKSESHIPNQEEWVSHFQRTNQHIKIKDERILLAISGSKTNMEK